MALNHNKKGENCPSTPIYTTAAALTLALSLPLILSLMLSFAPMTPAAAQGTDAQRRAAIAHAVDKAGGSGKVLSVKPYKNKDGKPGFRIRVLTDGRVRTFDIATARGQ